MELKFSPPILEKIPTYQISWKSVHWEPNCSMRTERQQRQTWRRYCQRAFKNGECTLF